MKIKVCGMRDAKNISKLIALDINYIGFIFYDKSKRAIIDFPEVVVPPFIKKVGVFVNESIENIIDLVDQLELNFIQLHGDESTDFINDLYYQLAHSQKKTKVEIIKAFSVDEYFDFSITKDYEVHCDLFIFDTKGKNYGGNGVKYDWNILKQYQGETPFLLSGGIGPNDVEAVNEFQHKQCIGVDLNSGFEDAPGIKNIAKLKQFKEAINV